MKTTMKLTESDEALLALVWEHSKGDDKLAKCVALARRGYVKPLKDWLGTGEFQDEEV